MHHLKNRFVSRRGVVRADCVARRTEAMFSSERLCTPQGRHTSSISSFNTALYNPSNMHRERCTFQAGFQELSTAEYCLDLAWVVFVGTVHEVSSCRRFLKRPAYTSLAAPLIASCQSPSLSNMTLDMSFIYLSLLGYAS